MDQSEFIEKYEGEKPIFHAWGKYIADQICSVLRSRGYDLSIFLKIPVSVRVKDNASILAKAFMRKEKHYSDPYAQITDKVGTRFVVLELSEIGIIKEIIEADETWNYSKDVDFEENRSRKPELFEYQSVHYILRNRNIIEYEGQTIPTDTPCEVQLRTLLQHAYAELSHQTVYKSTTDIDPGIRRKLARSMALIEATDELFGEVCHDMRVVDELYLSFINAAKKRSGFPQYVESLNTAIFDTYKSTVQRNGISADGVDAFITEKSYVLKKIAENVYGNILFEQPIILLLYYLVSKYESTTHDLWPFDMSYLAPIYSDLGISMPD